MTDYRKVKTMGTILNTAKGTRKNIGNAEKSIDDSIVICEMKDGIKRPVMVLTDKIFDARDDAREAIVQIKDVRGQLEKDSDKIPFYEGKEKIFEQFLSNTKWVLRRIK